MAIQEPKYLSLDNYKTYRGMTGSSDDEQLKMTLAGIELYILNYTSILANTDGATPSNYFDIDLHLFLDNLPIGSSISITYIPAGTTTRTYSDTLVDGTDYMVEADTGTIRLFSEGIAKISTVELPIKVTQTISEDTAFPADLELAGYELTKYWYSELFGQSKTQQNQSVANFNEGPTVEIPLHIKAILDKYRLM